MHIKNFKAQNYRNISLADISFAPGVNLLHGRNAQGKTNLLEGIYTFARGKSFRGAVDAELVSFGAAGYAIGLTCRTRARDISMAYRYEKGSRERILNGAHVRAGEMIGHMRAVLFCPDHLQMIKGGPAERRSFLNIAISQLDPLYIGALARYEKILSCRNTVLREAQKNGCFDRNIYEVYSEQLAAECAFIARARERYIASLAPQAHDLLLDLSGGKEKLEISYKRDTEGSEASDYFARLTGGSAREIAAGCTLCGTHKDDLLVTINGADTRSFASQGQIRSTVLSMKMAEGICAEKKDGERPVYLFDDVLSELDETRRAYLLSGTQNGQVILTACEGESLFPLAEKVIEVKDGVYQ